MKITNVRATVFEWTGLPEVSVFLIRRRPGDRETQTLITIETDEGLVGHAFLGRAVDKGSSDVGGLLLYLKPLLIGEDPLNRERLFRAMWKRHRQSSVRAVGALDIALWDLAGKAAGQPLFKLLGGYRDKIGAYCSSAMLPDARAYGEEAAQYKELGWHGYKIHTRAPWREHIAICQAVRDAVGDDPAYHLMMDSIFLYDYPQALRVGQAIQEMDYYWYEDPLGDQDIYNYVKLKQQLHIPIVATERPVAGLDSYASWITAKATDYLRGDVMMKGGITNVLKGAHLAEAFGMNYEIHVAGNALSNLANLHVELAIPNTTFHEIIMPYEGRHFGLLNGPDVDREGFIRPPDGPGLGAEIDFDLIRRNHIADLD